jgi:hypothetical protein
VKFAIMFFIVLLLPFSVFADDGGCGRAIKDFKQCRMVRNHQGYEMVCQESAYAKARLPSKKKMAKAVPVKPKK